MSTTGRDDPGRRRPAPGRAVDAETLASLVAFATVAESGSFAAAARRLGSTRSAVSKQVQRVERLWGVRLFHRTTRAVSLTEPGRVAVEHAAQILRSAEAARQAVERLSAEPRGVLRVTTSVAYGRAVIVPLLPGFLRRHPQLEVDLLLLDRAVDLAEESIDVAVRLTTRPPDLSIARALCPIAYRLVAAAGFAFEAPPRTPADLRALDGLHYARQGGAGEWVFRRGDAVERVRTRSRVAVNGTDVLLPLVLAGLGVAVLPDYVAQPAVAAGALQVLLPEWQVDGPFGDTVWALRLPERAVLPKVRAFVDHLLERLAPPPAAP